MTWRSRSIRRAAGGRPAVGLQSGGGTPSALRRSRAGADTAAAPPAPPPGPSGPRTPELALQEGNAALARRDYAAAEAAAREVLANRTSPRAYDAQFLLAQALAGEKQYPQAAVAYDDVYNRARTGSHAQDARLGLAVVLDRDQRKEGCLRRADPDARRVPASAAGGQRGDDGNGTEGGLPLRPDNGAWTVDYRVHPGDGAVGAIRTVPGSGRRGFRRGRQYGAGAAGAGLGSTRGGTIVALTVDHGLRPDLATRRGSPPNGWRVWAWGRGFAADRADARVRHGRAGPHRPV